MLLNFSRVFCNNNYTHNNYFTKFPHRVCANAKLAVKFLNGNTQKKEHKQHWDGKQIQRSGSIPTDTLYTYKHGIHV